MAALDFPLAPTVGQKYPSPGIPGLPVYTWDGEKWTTYGGAAPVSGTPGTILPKPNANPAQVGTSLAYAREDHVHPLDTSYVLKTGDEMSGYLTMTVGAPTAELHVATKKYVDDTVLAGGGASPSTTPPLMDSGTVGVPGSSAAFARGDHVHPSDTSRQATDADLTAIAALTGTGIARRDTAGSAWSVGTLVSNGELAQMPAFSLKVNNLGGLGAPTDIAITSLPVKDSPAGTDKLIISDQSASGSFKQIAISTLPGSSGGIAEAPNDGKQYGRQSLGWTEVAGGGLSPSNAVPAVDSGTGSAGTATLYSRGDHVHPSDTTKAPLASPTFTGDPKAPTPTAGDNDTSIATTAFVTSAVSAAVATPGTANPLVNSVAAPGSALPYSREDHVHPTDTSRAAASAVPPPATASPLAPAVTAVVGTATKYAREDHVHPQQTLPTLGTAASENIGTSGHKVPMLDADNTWGGIQGYAEIAVTPTSPIAWNVAIAPVATVALAAGATTMSAPINVVAGRVYTIRFVGAVSTVSWNTAFDFNGNAVPTITPSGIDRFTFIGRPSGILEEIGRSQNIGSP